MLVVDEAHAHRRRRPAGQGVAAAGRASPAAPHVVVTGDALEVARQPRAERSSVIRACASTWSTPPAPSSTTPAWPRPRPAPRSAALGVLGAATRTWPRRVRTHAATPGRRLRRRAPAGAVLSVADARSRARLAARSRPAEAARHAGRAASGRPSTPDGISRLRITAHADLTARAGSRRDGACGADRSCVSETAAVGRRGHGHEHRGRQDRRHRGSGRRAPGRGLRVARGQAGTRPACAGRARRRGTRCAAWPAREDRARAGAAARPARRPKPPPACGGDAPRGGRATRSTSSSRRATGGRGARRGRRRLLVRLDTDGGTHRRPSRQRCETAATSVDVRRRRVGGARHAQPHRADGRGAARRGLPGAGVASVGAVPGAASGWPRRATSTTCRPWPRRHWSAVSPRAQGT